MFTAESPSDDPLCRLSKAEKLRVCASVLTSSYFIGYTRILSNERELRAECTLNTVSFRSIRGKEHSNGCVYKEWMLSCRARRTVNGDLLRFSISQAYHPHYVFVYVRKRADVNTSNWEWYIENISGRVSLITDRGKVARAPGARKPLPNLIDTVQTFYKTI